MKRDLPGAIRKVAEFLGVAPSAGEWARINEYASFDWMKRPRAQVRHVPNTPVRVLEPGGMMRKGKAGASREDGMTEEIAQHMRAVGSKIVGDEAAMEWMYRGGELG